MLTYLPAIAIAMLRATRIMAVSGATAADVHRWFRRRPVVTLQPLAAMGVVGGPPAPVVQPREPVVVFNGGMDPRKNVATLIRAFAVFRQGRLSFRLVLMGRHYEAVLPLIHELGLADAVELSGYVSQERKLALLAAASVIAYPSSFEGYGLPIVEAMACGTPVVCGCGGSQQEIGGDAAIFVDPVTPAILAEALERAAALHDDAAALAAYRVRAARRLAFLSDAAIGDRIALLFAPDPNPAAGGATNHGAPAPRSNAAGDASDPSIENASLSN
jgi:glycosyltransferase involved in cell wall biosynthesis